MTAWPVRGLLGVFDAMVAAGDATYQEEATTFVLGRNPQDSGP